MKFLKKKLRNGMTVIMEKRDLPVVSLSISNPFGGLYEEEKIKGIAHVIEHSVFTGTKTRTHEQIASEIEKKGGILNAFTANEVTSFWFKLPSEHLFKGLDILTDIINNPTFDEKKFEKEKRVILEEIKMKHDDPSSYVYDKVFEVMYKKPFGIGIIGTTESVSGLKRDFVQEYYKNNYNCANFVVTIVGDGNFDKICAYLEKNFKSNGKKIKSFKFEKTNGNILEERDGIDQAHFVISMHAPLYTDKEHATLEVLNAYLAQGMSSKLFLKIREELGLAYTVRGSIDSEKSYSNYNIYVGTKKESVSKVKEEILKGFEQVENMNEEELDESKERIIGLGKITSEESSNVMNELLFAELTGDAKTYYNKEGRIKKVKLSDVKKLAKEIIREYSTAAIVPK